MRARIAELEALTTSSEKKDTTQADGIENWGVLPRRDPLQYDTAGLVEASPAVTYIFDTSSRQILFLSSQCEEVLGYPREELRAMGASLIPTLLHPDDIAAATANYNRMMCLPAGSVFEAEYRMRHKLGHYVWLLSRDRVIEHNRILGVALDITARKQAEGALERANSELNQFAHTVSHDLREPLRMIRAYSQLVDRKFSAVLGPESKQLFGFIIDGANRMERIIHTLLDFARATGCEAEFEVLHPAGALSEAVANLGARIQESGARVESTPLPTVVCTPTGLALIFQNLIANAITYSRPGVTPEIHISATSGLTHCTFAVSDNGQGIAEEHHARIFDMFTRLHAKNVPGTGIGLATVRRIVERCSGRIWLESQPGKGSTFYFTLPVAPSWP